MKPEVLRGVLSDARSGRVMFVSHCMLNQNVRYQGGATRPGAVDEVVANLQRAGVGIVQMQCPEQRAWGGVDKRYTMPAYGADQTRFRGCAARLAGCSCSTHVWPTAASRARSLAILVTTCGPASPYRRWSASAARRPVGCAPRWISRGCWTPSQAVTPPSCTLMTSTAASSPATRERVKACSSLHCADSCAGEDSMSRSTNTTSSPRSLADPQPQTDTAAERSARSGVPYA